MAARITSSVFYQFNCPENLAGLLIEEKIDCKVAIAAAKTLKERTFYLWRVTIDGTSDSLIFQASRQDRLLLCASIASLMANQRRDRIESVMEQIFQVVGKHGKSRFPIP